MKSLQILPSLNVGGVERGVVDLARAFKKRGEEIAVISSGGELVAELQKLGVPHYTLPVHRKSLFSLALVPKIVEVIRAEQIDVIHARSRVPAWLAWFAARQTGVPLVTTCHGYYSDHFLSRVMGWGKRVIVISRVIGRHMIDDFGVSPERIRLIHRGVDLASFPFHAKSGDSASESKSRRFRIITIGRFSPIKGQVEFLKAVHRLSRRLPNVEAWLVGAEEKSKNKYTGSIHQTLRQLGMESYVKLLGIRRDIPALLAQADLLVLPTLVPEAFGRVLIEAGAAGTPVVATGSGGTLDIIDHGENGLLVAPGDIEALAEAMFDLLKDRPRAKKFAERLRKKVEEEFTLDRMASQTLEVYDEVRTEKKFLVIKLGAMGDVILAVPSLRMIRERFPDASVTLLVDRQFAGLVSDCPYLDHWILVDREKLSRPLYFLKLAKKIRREAFDLSVDFQNSKWTHLLAAASGIRERCGFRRGSFGFLLTKPDRGFKAVEAPVKNQFRLLAKLGVRKLDETLELWPDEASEKKIEDLLGGKTGSEKKLVGFVIGSSPKWPTKRWPIDSFRQLAKRLIAEADCQVVLMGSDRDLEDSKGFEDLHPGLLDFVGKTSPRDLVSLVKRLDAIVTGDTAPLHIAGAVRTKIVALFGPTDPNRHMPSAGGAVVLMRNLSCQPCYRGVCRNEEKLACLTRISVEEVFQAVTRQLASEKKSAAKNGAHVASAV